MEEYLQKIDLEAYGSLLGTSSALLEASWSRPVGVWGDLGRSWRRLEASRGRLGGSWRRLGRS